MSFAAAPVRYSPDSACRHQSINDAQWILIEPFFPTPAATGRPPLWPIRRIFEAVLHLLRSGCQWRLIPSDFPPRSTIYRHFARWRDSGLFERINHALVVADRERVGREASPTAAVIDSQSVKTTETGGTKGYDGGKKINGSKRHILVDTDGRLLLVGVSPADWHDGRAGAVLLKASRRAWPFVERLFADRGYAGQRMATATPIAVTVVTGPKNQKGFIVQKRRWVVERTFGWIGRCRRLTRDYERFAETAVAFITLAAVMILVRRLARS